jgi:polysaccharide export outer membrane protein
VRAILLLSVVALLAACGALPHDGPSSGSLPKQAAQSILSPTAQAKGKYAIVDLDYAVTQQIVAHPPEELVGLARASSSAATDQIAEGDALAINIVEAGGGLFSRSSDSSGGVAQGMSLPRVIVDEAGDVSVPFGGVVHIAGLNPRQAAEAIRVSLRRRAVDPQVSVTVLDSRANSVVVLGEVRNSGHFQLAAHNDRLLDVIASAGGATRPAADLRVTVVRGGMTASAPLSLLMSDAQQNIRLAPQDQIRIVYEPRKFSTFGAFGRSGQDSIADDTLQERWGGPAAWTPIRPMPPPCWCFDLNGPMLRPLWA